MNKGKYDGNTTGACGEIRRLQQLKRVRICTEDITNVSMRSKGSSEGASRKK
jgi:hypothetical protein